MAQELSHIDSHGRARMVDVGGKEITRRVAVAEAVLSMRPQTLKLLKSGKTTKGDVLAVARVAGIQAAKRTHELIPLCHQLPLSSVKIDFDAAGKHTIRIIATARCDARTGVEMEALVAATIAGLTVYDMLKAADRGMVLSRVRLLEKSGGRSGAWNRKK